MEEISSQLRFILEEYEVLASHKKSKYALIKEKTTEKLFVADMINFKILYKLQSKIYQVIYIKPRSVVLNIPRTEYLICKENMAYIFFLLDYNQSNEVGILVYEENILYIFNSMQMSMTKITDLSKFILQAYYVAMLENDELFTGYHLSINYLNQNNKIVEVQISVLNQEKLKALGGIIINKISEINYAKFSYHIKKSSIELKDKLLKTIDIQDVPKMFEIFSLHFENEKSISNLKFLKYNAFLRE